MWKSLLVMLLVVLAPALLAAAANAKEIRVVVLDPDPNLRAAISVALSPWGLRVVSVPGPTPRTDLDGAAQSSARTLARAQDAGVVLWIAAAPRGPTSLWMYEAETEQLTVRPLQQSPPFDDAAAAALALTIKTLLRTTTAAPPQERTSPVASGSTAAAPVASPPAASSSAPAASATAVVAPAPTAIAPIASPASGSTHAWRFYSAVLAEGPTGASAPLTVRAGIGGSWWPPAWHEHLGFGVDVRAGPNVDVVKSSFVGSFGEVVAGASARVRVGSVPLSLELGAGPMVYVTSLSGTGGASGRAASVQRADPALDVEAIADVALGTRVRLGPLVGASILLRHQLYSLQGDVVLRMPSLLFDFGGRVSIALD